MGALDVAGGAESDGRNASKFHGVSFFLMVFVDFGVGAKGGMAVVFVVKTMPEDDFSRTPARRNTGGTGKVVELHDNKMDEMDKHHVRQLGVGKLVDDATAAFLDNTDAAFYLRNMLPRCRKV